MTVKDPDLAALVPTIGGEGVTGHLGSSIISYSCIMHHIEKG